MKHYLLAVFCVALAYAVFALAGALGASDAAAGAIAGAFAFVASYTRLGGLGR